RRHTRFSRDWSSDVCSSDLVLQQDRLTLHNEWFSSKVVDLNTIQEVRYFAGDYILKSDQKQEFRINTQVLAPSSLEKLEEVLSKIGRASCRERVEVSVEIVH